MSTKETILWVGGALLAIVLLAGTAHHWRRHAVRQPDWNGCHNPACNCKVCQCTTCKCGGRR